MTTQRRVLGLALLVAGAFIAIRPWLAVVIGGQ
jgi:hypothetical protein